ncbi:MAG: toprim domain-containing protein [Xenococcaceae cyanobacterium MO_167.B27]|nr:toprim domain-containing protein [Xenococcaceae cyanobacterium MO_167.B27]
MSFAVLDRNDSRRTIYISTDGAGQVPNEFLQQSQDVVVAYDNDIAGKLMAQRVLSQLPNAVRKLPKAIDWNEELVNRFNWGRTSEAAMKYNKRKFCSFQWLR